MNNPLRDTVADQYRNYPYPSLITDLEQWSKGQGDWFDPAHCHRLFWPDRDYPEGMNILVAGCGTNQAATIAYMNPKAHVTGIDVSCTSLDHERWLKGSHSLNNLTLYELPIEEAAELGCEFDLIISSGVLHHLADPELGLKTLGSCLHRDGVIGVMLYGFYGHFGVQTIRSVFRDIGLGQNRYSIDIARKMLKALQSNHPIYGHIQCAAGDPEAYEDTYGNDSWLVDAFLHKRVRTYTVDDCLKLIEASGLVFQDWLVKAPYYPHNFFAPAEAFIPLIAALPKPVIWSVMERMHATFSHLFTVCRSDRPKETYAIDFSRDDCLDYTPGWRHGCGMKENEIHRPGYSMPLHPDLIPLTKRIDGILTIREITRAAKQHDPLGRSLFEALWNLDFVTIGLRDRD